MTTQSYWDSLSVSEREHIIDVMNHETGASIGISNAKCTFKNVSKTASTIINDFIHEMYGIVDGQSTSEWWNSLTPHFRLTIIEQINNEKGTSFGSSNSKCTFKNISTKLSQVLDDFRAGFDSKPIIVPSCKSLDKVKTDIKEEVKPDIKEEVKPDDKPITAIKEVNDELDLLIMFDDTGSMSSARKLVKQQINSLVTSVSNEIKNLRIGMMIINDYCDSPFELISHAFTDNLESIKKFIHVDSPCGGGDYKECYELALNKARGFDWKSTNRAIILIADAEPHEVGYRYGKITNSLDWKKECEELAKMNIKIYSIQALGNKSASYFYDYMARITNGVKLDLSQFQHVKDYITAVAYKYSGNLEKFENSDPLFKTNLSLKNMFNKLKGLSGDASIESKMEILSKFQVMNVEHDMAIKDFVEMNGCNFQRGHGYYSLIARTPDGKANSEIIQANKEVIFVDKKTGEVSDNTIENRIKLGIPYGTKGTCRPLQIPDVMNTYDIFVQSNSYNRILDRGCKFLYLMSV